METTQNLPEEEKKTPKARYLSFDQQIGKMKLAFDNATLPSVFTAMKTVGFTNERIKELQNSVTNLETLQQAQTKEYAEQFSETEKLNTQRTQIDEIYLMHRNLCKVFLKTNTLARAALKLDQHKSIAYDAWFQEVKNFYGQLTTTPNLQEDIKTIGITADIVNKQLIDLNKLQSVKESQRKELAEAQQATDARDKAFDELYPIYSEFIKYARILLADDQALEAIGVKVKAK